MGTLIFIYLLLCALSACVGIGRVGGYWLSFALAFFGSPLLGWALTMFACRKIRFNPYEKIDV